MNYFLAVLKKYAVFSGRARRSEYWYFALFNVIYLIVALILHYRLRSNIEPLHLDVIYFVYILALLIPNLALTVRRLHDVGKSGWMLLIGFIPLVGAIWLFGIAITKGIKGDNNYGTDPKLVPEVEN
jgi:uncharacterized membrane protein YhaH (DUF805 family)